MINEVEMEARYQFVRLVIEKLLCVYLLMKHIALFGLGDVASKAPRDAGIESEEESDETLGSEDDDDVLDHQQSCENSPVITFAKPGFTFGPGSVGGTSFGSSWNSEKGQDSSSVDLKNFSFGDQPSDLFSRTDQSTSNLAAPTYAHPEIELESKSVFGQSFVASTGAAGFSALAGDKSESGELMWKASAKTTAAGEETPEAEAVSD